MNSELPLENSSTTEIPVSAENEEISPAFLYIYSILAVMTIGGNGIVVISYVIDKSIRLSTPNTYILNLAIADFLVGGFDFLASFIWSVSGADLNPSFVPCFLWSWLRHAGTLASAVVVLLVSWDRYKLVSNALTYRRDQTPGKAALRNVIAWAAVCTYTFILHVVGTWFLSFTPGCIRSRAPNRIIVYTFFVEVLIPVLVIVVLNVKVLLALRQRTKSKLEGAIIQGISLQKDSSFEHNANRKSSNVIPEGNLELSSKTLNTKEEDSKETLEVGSGSRIGFENQGIKYILADQNGTKLGFEKKKTKKSQNPKETKKKMHKLYKAVKALVIFTSIYISCWIPFYVITLVSLVKSDISDWVSFLGALIISFNSTINPFLYAAMSRKFRRRIFLLLKCQFLRK
ncbi:Muscarinic acetylcholine receptor M1 [Holothuria leucospilota]|uniref:Muscarinic acetylcholine receptor M1 n=1 Tax=Holothuria leucospilota TaxID=206669 RepID=A0A9Q1HFZ1_HOLLE|nr:Muscarinic acetylcholine receptor M1 [Holothuria leucospilota]